MWTVRFKRAMTASLAAVAAVTASSAIAHADPEPGKKAKVLVSKHVSGQRTDLTIDSPAMDGRVTVSVLSPGGTGPRPTLYMLDGADAGEKVSDWLTKGGAQRYFAGRNVNVVLPAGGAGSFYTNWAREDRKIGKPQWETFLTEELPPLIDEKFSGSGRNGILGLSMGGQAAFALTARHPQLYQAVASLSGCPPVSGPANEAYVRTTVAKGGGDANNMWGAPGSAKWREHDPSRKLSALRGKKIFLSAGTGAVGPLDLIAKTDPDEGPADAQIAAGSALEVGAYRCSLEFATALSQAGIRYTPGFRVIGTHRWEYWKQDLPRAWSAIAPAL